MDIAKTVRFIRNSDNAVIDGTLSEPRVQGSGQFLSDTPSMRFLTRSSVEQGDRLVDPDDTKSFYIVSAVHNSPSLGLICELNKGG